MARSLIIGGTKGLGRAIAKKALASRHQVIVCARDVGDAPMDKDLYGATLCSVDVSKPDGIERLFGRPTGWEDITHVFWTAGTFAEGALTDIPEEKIHELTAVHFTGLVCNLAILHRMLKQVRPLADKPGRPYHLVVVSSTSAWRVRDGESVYAALCAAKSHFVRQFARELVRELPGSKVTLVHPGGMNNPHFWAGTGRDTSTFMDSRKVASIILGRALKLPFTYDEYSIMRSPHGEPEIKLGPQSPEAPPGNVLA